MVLNRRAIRQTDFRRGRKRKQRAKIPTPGVVANAHVALYPGQARGADGHLTVVVGLDLLPAEAPAQRHLVVDPIGDRRVDVGRLDIELVRLRTTLPRLVVLGRQTKGAADSQADVKVLVQRPGDVAIGDKRPATGITAVTGRIESADRGTLVVELEARSHRGQATGNLACLQLGHPRRVPENRAGVVGLGRRTSVGVAQTAALLQQLKTRRPRRARKRHQQKRRDQPHRNLL